MEVVQIRGEAAEMLEALAVYYGTDKDTAAAYAIAETVSKGPVFDSLLDRITKDHNLDVDVSDTGAFYRLISDKELDNLERAAEYTAIHQGSPDGGEYYKKELEKIVTEKARREQDAPPF